MKYNEIRVSNLDLDIENPRHGVVRDQAAAFQALAREQGSKLIKLALDIHDNGLHPAHRLIVMARPEDRYVVLDGNRRLAALRLLADPSLLQPAGLPGNFSERVGSPGNAPSVVDCYVVESRDDARLWLERTHTGEQGGLGVISWSSSAQVRFSPGRPTQASRGVAAVDWMRARIGDNTELQGQLLQVENRITNLGRLVSDPDVRRRLGFSFSDNTLVPTLSEDTVLTNLTTMIADLAGGRSVTQFKSKSQRTKYIRKLIPSSKPNPSSLPLPPPRPKRTPPSQPPLTSPRPKPTPERSTQPRAILQSATPPRADLSLFDNVVADGLSYRIGLILAEIQRIDVEAFPNASAVLIRCIVDMVVKDYAKAKKLADRGSLQKNIRSAMVSLGIAQNDQRYHSIRTSLSSQNSLFGVSNLQQYVHNLDTHPVPTDLVQIARNYCPLIEDIALALRSNNNPR